MRIGCAPQRRVQGVDVVGVYIVVPVIISVDSHVAGVTTVLRLTPHYVVIVVEEDPLQVLKVGRLELS